MRVRAFSPLATIGLYAVRISAFQLPSALPETEPNEDGSPSVGLSNNGNDFSTALANGPYSADAYISGAINPAGDEDVFAVTNPGGSPAVVVFDTAGAGGGGTCAASDTFLHIRDAAGTSLASNDNDSAGFCSGLTYVIPPGATVYAHVLDHLDDGAIVTYHLVINFL